MRWRFTPRPSPQSQTNHGKGELDMTKRWHVSSDWRAYLFWLVLAWAIGLGSLAVTVLRGQ
jgi:hypothetical protein